ncbi:MAG: type II toxin-antitoxin system VapC family toxin [Chloroflexi bacterium]|nr:type II toxin-antitoxin system VapC family toxin [Chloroflexota bacterium]
MTHVCVDAGLIVKFVSPESDSELVEAQLQQWKTEGVDLIAPAYAAAEIDSVLRNKVVRKELAPDVAEAAFHLALRLPIAFESTTEDRERAWELAKDLGLPTVYDAVYLAVAERKGCEFWTADRKLVERAIGRLRWVRGLGGRV